MDINLEDYTSESPIEDWEIETTVGNTTLPYEAWVREAVASAREWGLLDEQYEETGDPYDEA